MNFLPGLGDLGSVVACGGGETVAEAAACWAYDGSSWSSLPNMSQPHCPFTTYSLVVDKGFWVSGIVIRKILILQNVLVLIEYNFTNKIENIL